MFTKIFIDNFGGISAPILFDFISQSRNKDKLNSVLKIEEGVYVNKLVGIMGGNASGKTSILKAISMIGQILTSPILQFDVDDKMATARELLEKDKSYENMKIIREIIESINSSTDISVQNLRRKTEDTTIEVEMYIVSKMKEITGYYTYKVVFNGEEKRIKYEYLGLEFYQLDLEMSYVTEEEVLELGEDLFHSVFTKFSDKEVSPKPFRRISYTDAMEKYGTDKPDLRNPLLIEDVSTILKDTTFGPFKGSVIKAIVVEDIADKPNSWFNEVVDYASSIGMPGIGYLTLMGDGTFKGPIDKFLNDEERDALISGLGMKEGSVIFFIANKVKKIAQKFAGQIRIELGRKLELIDPNKLELCIIKDFPMFEYDEKLRKYEFCHNPFSLPHKEHLEYNKDSLDDVLAYQYDFVCNGNEMASGAIRNSNLDSLVKGFEVVGYTREEVEKRFQSLFTAFKYGCPPHGGMALGIDRVIMLIKDESNLREVQAFPTSTSGSDLMMGSPSTLTKEQLDELGIKVKEEYCE